MKIDCVFLDFGPLGTEFRKPIRRKLEVEDMTVTATIRGEKCRFLVPSSYVGGTLVYNVKYPQPFDVESGRLVDVSATQMRAVSDNSFLRAMIGSVEDSKTSSLVELFGRFVSQTRKRRLNFLVPSQSIVDFLKRVGIPLDVEGRECLVISKSDLEKVEKGELK